MNTFNDSQPLRLLLKSNLRLSSIKGLGWAPRLVSFNDVTLSHLHSLPGIQLQLLSHLVSLVLSFDISLPSFGWGSSSSRAKWSPCCSAFGNIIFYNSMTQLFLSPINDVAVIKNAYAGKLVYTEIENIWHSRLITLLSVWNEKKILLETERCYLLISIF